MQCAILGKVSAVADSVDWVRANQCTPGNNCVELWFGRETIIVRDSKNVDRDVLAFPRDRWICFLARVVR